MPTARHAALVLATLLGTVGPAQAVSVTLFDSVSSAGDTLTYLFTGLPTTSFGDGLLTLATTGGISDGIDLGSISNEYMDVDFDGTSFGRWECGTANDGGTLIPGASPGSDTFSDCLFSLPLTVGAATLAPAIADGSVLVTLQMGIVTDPTSGGDEEIAVTLSYDEFAAVPLPASVPLLLAGLGGLALLRRRRR